MLAERPPRSEAGTSFPDEFRFLDDNGASDLISYRLVGNAVPLLVSRAFAGAVAASLTTKRRVQQIAS